MGTRTGEELDALFAGGTERILSEIDLGFFDQARSH
jgi:hypothetical protein